MAAPQFTPPTVRDYRYLHYAFYSLVAGNLNSQISRDSFLGQPLQRMTRDLQAILSHNDPGRKFPTALLRGEPLMIYFLSLLQEVHENKLIVSQLEYAVERGDWKNINLLPIPLEIQTQKKKEQPEQEAEGKHQTESSGSQAETTGKQTSQPREGRRIRYSSAFASRNEETRVTPQAGETPKEEPVIVRRNRFLHEFLQGARERMTFSRKQPVVPNQQNPGSETQKKGLVRPVFPGRSRFQRRNIRLPAVLNKQVKDRASDIKILLIRNPGIMVRILSATIGATIGGILGKSPLAALGGAAIGAITGPGIFSSILNMGVPENPGEPDSQDVVVTSPSGSGSGNGSGGGTINIRRLGNAARLTGRGAALAAQVGSRMAVLLASPFTWIVLGIAFIVLIVILMLMCVLPFAGCNGPGSAFPGKPGDLNVTVEKSGPREVENGQKISYQITVTNKGNKPVDTVVSDRIPEKTTYDSGDNDPVPEGTGVAEAKWTIKGLGAGQSKVLNLTVAPIENDTWIINKVSFSVSSQQATSSGGITGSGLLPDNISPAVGNWNNLKPQIIDAVNKHPEVIAAYKKASEMTGVPWEVLAGLHFVETGSSPNPGASLVSGRKIGAMEPDIPRSACASGESGPGVPVPMGGGCGFTTFEDSAIYSAKHIIGKIGKVPSTFQDAVTALSRYNGGGNSNCGRGVPYNFCPEDFDGEDDPYAMNYYDQKHSEMYLIYCADFTKCSPPRPFGRPGAMAVVRALLEKN